MADLPSTECHDDAAFFPLLHPHKIPSLTVGKETSPFSAGIAEGTIPLRSLCPTGCTSECFAGRQAVGRQQPATTSGALLTTSAGSCDRQEAPTHEVGQWVPETRKEPGFSGSGCLAPVFYGKVSGFDAKGILPCNHQQVPLHACLPHS